MSFLTYLPHVWCRFITNARCRPFIVILALKWDVDFSLNVISCKKVYLCAINIYIKLNLLLIYKHSLGRIYLSGKTCLPIKNIAFITYIYRHTCFERQCAILMVVLDGLLDCLRVKWRIIL